MTENNNDKIKVFCEGGAEAVTGSNFILEYKGKKIAVDCGLPQGEDAKRNGEYIVWNKFSYDPGTIDYLLITHAHLDHIGKVAFFVANGFRGKIISTKATKEIAIEAMFDAYKLMAEDFLHKGINELPYRGEDVETAIAMWSSVNYRENLNLFNQEGFKIDTTFFNSSHILGSAFVQINCDGKKALFTGDMGNDSLLLEEADIPDNSDYVFMETVYGNRVHEHIENRKENLRQVILDVIHKKGTLVIPAFAIERTQEVLSEINDFVEERKMPVIPVYLDSPLSIAITKIFYHYKNLLNKESREKMGRGDDIFNFPGLHFSHNRYDSIEINKIHGPKIVIAGSGMVAGGRVIHHIRQYIEHKQNTILFVGYQSHGTAGRRLQQGEKHMNFFGTDINVEAEIKTVSGYSAHRDMNSLLKFVQAVKKKAVQIFLILGDKESTQGFQKFVKEKENLDVEICKEKIEYILG